MASHPLVAIPAVTPTAAAIPAHVSVSTSATVTSSVDAAPTHTGTSSLSAPQTLVATPNVLEVGLASGTHGWLKIRAELEPATGQVSAAVLASSNSAAESLHHQLPAISAYLAGEQVNLSSLVVDRTSTPNMAADAGPAGGGSTPPRYEKSGSNSTAPATSWTPAETTAPQSNLAPESYPSTAGGWLSVRA
jgi:hypothetical protein